MEFKKKPRERIFLNGMWTINR